MKKNHILEEKMNEELKRYQQNMDDKDIEIQMKLKKVEELQKYVSKKYICFQTKFFSIVKMRAILEKHNSKLFTTF